MADLRHAARRAGAVFEKIGRRLRAAPENVLASCGIPAAAQNVCRLRDPLFGETFVGRFDFAAVDGGFRLLEWNAETPYFWWESFAINGAIAREFGFVDPNETGLTILETAIRQRTEAWTGTVAVTANNTYREDWFTADFIAKAIERAIGRPVARVPVHELQIADNRLRDGSGRALDTVWRCYALEHFAADRDGAALFDLIERGHLRFINPVSALLAQSKAAQAIIWALRTDHDIFDDAERETIADIFLPTFLEQPESGSYVRKPVLGREGASIAILHDGVPLVTSERDPYSRQPMVYQHYVDTGYMEFANSSGVIVTGRPIYTCFLIDGEPGPIGLRIGGEIADDWAHFCPLGIRVECASSKDFYPQLTA